MVTFFNFVGVGDIAKYGIEKNVGDISNGGGLRASALRAGKPNQWLAG